MLVMKVVGFDERIILSKFEKHWRSPENGCRPPLPAEPPPVPPPEKYFFCRDFDEEFNGISFRIFGGVLDKFKNC